MKHAALAALALASCLSLSALPAQGAGLRTKFGQVRVKGIKIGQTYSLDRLLKLPLRIVNTGDETVDLRVDVIPVSSGTATEGYEPVPDFSWVKLDRNDFTVEPGHEALTDVVVSIPDDPKLLGRRFEAHIWSRTKSTLGSFAVGVMSRLLLEISSIPPTEEELKKKFVDRQIANLDFTLYPTEGAAEGVPLGVDFDLKKERRLAIKLVNPNDAEIRFKIRSMPLWESLLTPPAGFVEPPDYNWVRPSTDTVTVPGNSIKETSLIVNIPDLERYRGLGYFFSISVEALDQEASTRVFYKLAVKTRPADKAAEGKGK